MLPDQQHCVEHGLEQLNEGYEVIHAVELFQILAQRFQIFDGVICLCARIAYILEQPASIRLADLHQGTE